MTAFFRLGTFCKRIMHSSSWNRAYGSTFSGGEIVFTGTPQEMIENGTTITSKYLRK